MINPPFKFDRASLNRRKFIKGSATTAGVLLATPLLNKVSGYTKINQTVTVKQIMDVFISEVPGGVLTSTVDTLKAGSADTVVTGIVTSMFATVEVIRKTIDLGTNFIIAHEPTFYNHTDDTSWLKNDEVYQYKAGLLKEHGIAVWRNHDYIHSLKPDGVTTGVLAQLGWQKYTDKDLINLLTLPLLTLKDLIDYLKQKLNIEMVRYIGNPNETCSRVLFLPGAAGGQTQIMAAARFKPDVLICGEISEWETAEYVRDARAKGQNLSLILLGHIASEQPGSEYMLNWLKQKFPSIKSTYISCGNSLSFL
jgi:putative NIF3 family GTP cyclohydrolase 1 type 2